MTPATRCAIVYDFDGTLAPGSMQEHSFIPELAGHLGVPGFWDAVRREAQRNDADEILVYMHAMLACARDRGRPITRAMLARHGEVPLFDGLEPGGWFDRLDAHGRRRGLEVEHYVVSSGLHEMIEGCSIYPRFKQVFASRFLYDERGEAAWPAVAVNYTTKTQFLFRINKGIDDSWDGDRINRWVPMQDRPLPFQRMIFIGDGVTDIPSMKTVRTLGGVSIAVFDPRATTLAARELVLRLLAEERACFAAPASYVDGSQLEIFVRGVLDRIAAAPRCPRKTSL